MSTSKQPRRYSFQSGNNLPPSAENDLEAQTDDKKKEKKKGGGCCCGCCGCCCCCLIFTFLVIGLVCILGIVFFPKKPNIKQVSLDITKGAVYEIESKNGYDIKLNKLFGDVTFEGDPLVEFEKNDIVIKKKAKTTVDIPLKPKMSPELLKHCATNKDFKAQINISVIPALLAWTKKPIQHTEKITIPCPKLPKELASISADLKDLPLDKISEKDIAKLIASK